MKYSKYYNWKSTYRKLIGEPLKYFKYYNWKLVGEQLKWSKYYNWKSAKRKLVGEKLKYFKYYNWKTTTEKKVSWRTTLAKLTAKQPCFLIKLQTPFLHFKWMSYKCTFNLQNIKYINRYNLDPVEHFINMNSFSQIWMVYEWHILKILFLFFLLLTWVSNSIPTL